MLIRKPSCCACGVSYLNQLYFLSTPPCSITLLPFHLHVSLEILFQSVCTDHIKLPLVSDHLEVSTTCLSQKPPFLHLPIRRSGAHSQRRRCYETEPISLPSIRLPSGLQDLASLAATVVFSPCFQLAAAFSTSWSLGACMTQPLHILLNPEKGRAPKSSLKLIGAFVHIQGKRFPGPGDFSLFKELEGKNKQSAVGLVLTVPVIEGPTPAGFVYLRFSSQCPWALSPGRHGYRVHRCSSPLGKTAQYLRLTYARPPVHLKSALGSSSNHVSAM